MADKVQVRIKPLKGIGGVGNAGDVVWMSPSDAEMYFRDGYVEYVSEERLAVSEEQEEKAPEVEDHQIMKPQSKRTGKVSKK